MLAVFIAIPTILIVTLLFIIVEKELIDKEGEEIVVI